MKAARTSSPTSKCRGPIAGPIQAASAPGSSAEPRHGRLQHPGSQSTPSGVRRGHRRAVGGREQHRHAVSHLDDTDRARPPGDHGIRRLLRRVRRSHRAPGRRCRGPARPRPARPARARCAHTRRRFSFTASAASPTCAPTLSEAYGAGADAAGAQRECRVHARRRRPLRPDESDPPSRCRRRSPAIRLERVQQALHVRRQRRLPPERAAGQRMLQLQTRGMQRLARKRGQRRGELRRGAGRTAGARPP